MPVSRWNAAAHLLAAVAWLCAAGAARAQYVVDGSGGDITDDVRQEIFELVTENFRDPLTSQFRRLHRASKANRYCGEVNTRNMYGAYGGFKPFLVVLEGSVKTVDAIPVDDPPKLRDAELKAKLKAMNEAGCAFAVK